ncbi:baseplate J/gp47 family protein [Methanobrevibacter sp.]|uniref:baseplate J/gp47 family protein n=1 Tax=Methanobrevibacter sp. TaxID=66852 RepID=UPI0038906564
MTNYVEKTFEEIFNIMLEDSLEKGLISHAEEFESYINNQEDISNFYVMSDAVLAKMFKIAYRAMTSVYESDKIDYAEGEDLDNIGKKRGIPRPKATFAEVNVTFTLMDVINEDVTIPRGVIVSTNDGIRYTTLEDIYIPSVESSATVKCKSVEPGVSSKIIENRLVNIVSALPYNFTCINNESSSGGTNEYTDDEYRHFILNWFKIHLKGSFEAFEYYFANCDGVDGYKLIPNWGVTGYSKIIVDPGDSYQLNEIYNDLKSAVAQYDEDLFLCAPEDVYIDIHAIVDVDIDQVNPYSPQEKENIKNRIISAIKTFIDGGYINRGGDYEGYYGGMLIGEDFIPHKLAVFLDDKIPELKNITFNYPEDYIPIPDEGKGKSNTIFIEMI